MKHKFMIAAAGLIIFSSCSLKQMAFNSAADMLAPNPGKKTEVAAGNANNPMVALTGESDVQLVADVMPVILKTYEILHLQNPKHRGLALMAGELYIMYANAFVQTPADALSEEFYNKKNMEYVRAKKFYLRGADYVFASFDLAYPGFTRLLSNPAKNADYRILDRLQVSDVESLYWAGAGILGAFSLDPTDADIVDRLQGAVALLEHAVKLNPGFNNGALWEILTAFYAAAPDTLGGGIDKAEKAYEAALQYSGGKNASTYVTFARSFCIPNQDSAGFDTAIDQALAINPDDNPKNRLMTVLSQQQAQLLKERKSEYFLEF